MKNLLFLIALLLSFKAYAGEATYKLTFKGNFDSVSHPVRNFPSNPHFSPPVVASHNGHFSMFQLGDKATPGVKNVAETGSPTKLLSELSDLQSGGIVKEFNRSRGLDGTESVSLEITISKEFPLISFITMIAPSPDWIIGVSGYSLVQDGEFIVKRTLPLYALDAGTDKGMRFTSRDMSLRKAEDIHLLIDVSGKSINKPFGILTLEKM
ncbi:MAG: spondin domain-containing protein [Bacteriovoracaceae bacterium]|nr:spondin domain-containing protein [Bacteriovoracaceae bacterium]